MSPLKIALSFLGQLFLFLIFCGAIINILAQQDKLMSSIENVELHGDYHDIKRMKNAILHAFETEHAYKENLWQAYTFINKTLGYDTLHNFSVIKVQGERLYRGSLYSIDDKNTMQLAENIVELAKIAEKSNAKLFYLSTPDSVIKGMDPLPSSLPIADFNGPIDSLLYKLRENNIPTLDARYALSRKSFPLDKISIKTGTMLTAAATFEIFEALVESLNSTFALTLDPDYFYRNRENYKFTPYVNFFLGQLGKESGVAFAGLDDFTTVEPRFDSAYQIEAIDMYGNFFKAEGDTAVTLLDPIAITYSANSYNFYPQSFYRHSNTAWSRIANRNNPEGLNLLLVHDTHTVQLVSHLAPLFKTVHTLAWQDAFPVNAEEYLQTNSVDLILVAFNPQTLTSEDISKILLVAK